MCARVILFSCVCMGCVCVFIIYVLCRVEVYVCKCVSEYCGNFVLFCCVPV